ncbi:MAG: ribonuclease III [Sedimentisphaeraceae bacterium JB056]
MDNDDLEKLQKKLGYKFKNIKLLEQAMTHCSSVVNRFDSNERLEFFGDAILDMVICEWIYDTYEDMDEGSLTQLKSSVVSRKSCSTVAEPLELAKFTILGKGSEKLDSISNSVAAGVLEAIIAAIYLDSGYKKVKKFILDNFSDIIEETAQSQHKGNYKSLLQHYTQKKYGNAPHYEIVDEQGPDHNKCFESEVLLGLRSLGRGWGVNKKQADQKAAYNALVDIGVIDSDTGEIIEKKKKKK